MKKTMRFIDLFAGMGGIRIGFENACNEYGIESKCILTSEIKDIAIKALTNNFKHENLVGDIKNVETKDIPDFDVLLAGFPCQPFSSAGNRQGFSDTRGTLFFEIERILADKRPYAFILENVEGLVTHEIENKNDKYGRTLKIILSKLEQLNYNVSWKLLDSKDFGVPQSRKRVYIIGTLDSKIDLDKFNKKEAKLIDILETGLPVKDSHFTRCLLNHYSPEELYGKAIKDKRGGENNIHSWDIGLKGEISEEQRELLEKLFKERRRKKWSAEIGISWMDGIPLTKDQISTFFESDNLKEILDDLVEKGYLKLEHPKDKRLIESPDGTKRIKRVPIESKEKGYNIVAGKLSFEFTKILDPNDIAPTLVATDANKLGVVDGSGIRQLSIREGLRLCGYPDTYNLSFFNNEKGMDAVYDLLGNTVVIPVIEEIAKKVIDTWSNKRHI
ncbi:DNA (cytosine-5-)-methyltransferase [Bacillus sp. 007/AIA-02/001]|uniref:DNA (cytosine-5-)-methyltransferase n=1 Tax=Bacillus TaxID=1386 RepID=UPI0010755F9C|nr:MULTISPECIES: DNA (cytosine-5-)-methyltransferase [Bacillus]MDA2423200.1 DNA (cytosine-5-)-methyltransferase [Bacillus cereus]MDA2429384.1 DNA (cytosine-5-)-methyltransferase [Bacillus cereus]MDD9280875.1 DNA (cytosine-5-)-methyltransferase [Bacillus thuringiensis]TFW48795.1 DNA (cytosine-5-)-methyltransferase [Bacillus sp. 007/AIA-02/001]